MKKMNLGGSNRPSIIGIDLGTTNSAVAVYDAGTVATLLPIGKDGSKTVPSCVRFDGFDADGTPLYTVGAEAYSERYLPNVIYSVKRIMGTDEVVTLKKDGQVVNLSPKEVSSIILKYLKDKTEEFHSSITDCVITVPAYFNQRQMNDTAEAAKLAGLNCLQILKEPTSASYIYSKLGYAKSGNVLIYDLGGGTFDVTHMTFVRKDGIPKTMLSSLKKQYDIDINSSTGADNTDQYFCRVLGTYGDMELGGDDIDKALGDKLIKDSGLNPTNEERERLYLECEMFKKIGASSVSYTLCGQEVTIGQADLQEATEQIFQKTLDIMRDIDMSNVSTIVLVGGSTKSEYIRSRLEAIFPNIEVSSVLNPDETVAIGAGAVAKDIAGDKSLAYSDVLPMPIGILVDQKRVDTCLEKNTPMPYTSKRVFRTQNDNQTEITIHVFQGLSEDTSECIYLGRSAFTGIPPAPAGEVKVEVSFVLTGQGRLKIVSRVNDIDKEEELVIDNIFSVAQNAMKAADPYEEVILSQLEDCPNKEDIQKLLEKRRGLTDETEILNIENLIAEKLF